MLHRSTNYFLQVLFHSGQSLWEASRLWRDSKSLLASAHRTISPSPILASWILNMFNIYEQKSSCGKREAGEIQARTLDYSRHAEQWPIKRRKNKNTQNETPKCLLVWLCRRYLSLCISICHIFPQLEKNHHGPPSRVRHRCPLVTSRRVSCACGHHTSPSILPYGNTRRPPLELAAAAAWLLAGSCIKY